MKEKKRKTAYVCNINIYIYIYIYICNIKLKHFYTVLEEIRNYLHITWESLGELFF